jgi:hypothetical protein
VRVGESSGSTAEKLSSDEFSGVAGVSENRLAVKWRNDLRKKL